MPFSFPKQRYARSGVQKWTPRGVYQFKQVSGRIGSQSFCDEKQRWYYGEIWLFYLLGNFPVAYSLYYYVKTLCHFVQIYLLLFAETVIRGAV